MAKSFEITKFAVWEAYLQIKKNGGAAGVDDESIKEFEIKLKSNLYRIWNRMSSGSYFPPAVKAVEIPKKSGGHRTLGIPTVSDRISQMVVKNYLDRILDPIFHTDSYGYRRGKSAHQAVEVTKRRCWKHKWVLEFDIKGLFDNIDHTLLMKSLRFHCKDRWVLLYVERWLKAPMLDMQGNLTKREKGTPQGGVVSPLLANLFLHYTFDVWMVRENPQTPFCRYADDGLLHLNSLGDAQRVKQQLGDRLKLCGLEMHPKKTKIVYCGTEKWKNYSVRSFDFLGFTFRRRGARGKYNKFFTGFLPAISKNSLKDIMRKVRSWRLHLKSNRDIVDLSKMFNSKIRGWFNYYGKFYKSALYPIWRQINQYLSKWVMRRCKKFRHHKTRASKWLKKVAITNSCLFVHWSEGHYHY